ncbi:MAG: hypothetical protein ACLP3R_08340, partial [Candidatus Korobacteraceae bacterium]
MLLKSDRGGSTCRRGELHFLYQQNGGMVRIMTFKKCDGTEPDVSGGEAEVSPDRYLAGRPQQQRSVAA